MLCRSGRVSGGLVVERDLDHRRVGRHASASWFAPGVRGDPRRRSARRSASSVMIRAVAGRSALTTPLRWNVRCGSAARLWIQARVRSARGLPADVDPPVDVVEHDLDAARLPGPATGGRDVDRVPTAERVPDPLVHGRQPLSALAAPQLRLLGALAGLVRRQRLGRVDVAERRVRRQRPPPSRAAGRRTAW